MQEIAFYWGELEQAPLKCGAYGKSLCIIITSQPSGGFPAYLLSEPNPKC